MAITVKHNKVSTIPDTDDTSLVRPSDWNADHTLVGTIDVANGGTGASTLTGYVKGNGTSAMTAVATVPSTDITGLGTMSTQNANAVAITGGTINGTTIGATTPSTVNATTITGQTGVLRGTGQNLIIQSNGFTVALGWAVVASTSTGSQSDPFGGSTASLLTADGTSSGHNLQSPTLAFTSGITYTTSVFFKAGTNNFAQIRMTGAVGGFYGNFNISTGVAGTTTATSSSIVSVGSGWYRASITFVASASASAAVGIFIITSNTAGSAEVNTLATSITVYGSQIEVGSTANTYIPTTTTAIYGTPTLSFSGVSTIGLESNGSLFVQPAGTGALQAQATTSTTAGGNARGAYAVDWQTSRSASAARVASGAYAAISGGINNSATGFASITGCGDSNQSTNTYSFIGGGASHTSSGYGASIVGGYTNTAAGYFNFIGGGSTNSGTALAAVTTQSGTMNGTTAVTLSGSNANIKVGQLITGTSINNFPNTYVAAISGTSLTLSQNASGSSTSTLSFFTPHGVVVGGGNNQATGSYSFIGGGGDAGTAANRNVASGDYAVVVGGRGNTASGIGSFVGGGGLQTGFSGGNTASGEATTVAGGFGNIASNIGATVVGGYQNTANGAYSTAIGRYATTRGINGNIALSPAVAPISFNSGNSQIGLLVLARQTTDATATALTSDGAAASGTNQVILPNNSAYFFTGEVISGVTGGGNTKGWTIEGVIKRGANAASTTLVGVTVTSMYADVGAATWTIAVTADTTNGGLRVTFTGQASTTIRTVCQIRTTEMTY
jgi:hypothetical protein